MNDHVTPTHDDFAKDVETQLNKDFPGTKVPLSVRMPRTELKVETKSLTEQWHMMQNISSELRDRIRRERIAIIADHDRRWVELQSEYARELSETKARLDKAHADKLRQLKDETTAKLHENEILTREIGE